MLLCGLFILSLVSLISSEEDKCKHCVDIFGKEDLIEILEDIILDGGLIAGCHKLCKGYEKYGKAAEYACDGICDGIGILAFYELVKWADGDAIWICQELKKCPVHDCTLDVCSKIVDQTVTPDPPLIGGPVTFDFDFEIYEQTGPGQVSLRVKTSNGSEPAEIEHHQWIPDGYPKGNYKVSFELEDDPTADPPVKFLPGLFTITTQVCEGKCGSHHSHSRTLDDDKMIFNMTQY